MLKFVPAEIADSKLILRFIKELAIAEEFPFPVSVTLSDIETNLFGKNAVAKAVILHFNKKTCGFVVYYYTFSTTTGKRGLHLDDLYIEPEYQGKGIGKKTLIYLAKIAKKNNCGRIEWWALNTNVSAIKFYLSIGAVKLEEISVFRLDQSRIENLLKDNKTN